MDPFNLPPLAFNGIRLFSCFFLSALAVQFFFSYKDQLRFFEGERDKERRGRVLGFLAVPKLSISQFKLSGLLFFASLMLAVVGILPRFFLFIALVTYFLYFGQILSLAYIVRKTNILPIVFIILLFSPGLEDPFNQSAPQWSLWLIKVQLSAVYFVAALSKISRSGLGWANSENLQANLLSHYLLSGRRSALWLAQKPTLCGALAVGTLFFEITFPVILFFPILVPLYALAGLCLHILTAATMRIEYIRYFCLSYFVFVIDFIDGGFRLLSH